MPKENEKILTIEGKEEEKFLRKKTEPFKKTEKGWSVAGDSLTKGDLHALVARMRRVMRKANGIGLSANQIGLPYRLFVAAVPDKDGNLKFYSFLNPEIQKSGEDVLMEEGCLSVPLIYGEVPRPAQVTVTGLDKNGKPQKVKAWGLLARVFQHEIDHLNGNLFVDKAKNLVKAEYNPAP